MKKQVLFSFALSVLVITVSYSQNKIEIKEFKLDNGLTVLLNEDHNTPEVFGAVMVKAGSKDDPADATGMAHYMEHMLFKGTTELGTIDWEKEKPHIDKIFSLYDELGQTKEDTARERIQKQINAQSLDAAKYAIPNELSNVLNSIGGTSMNAGTGPDYTIFFNAFPSSQMEKWLELYSHRFIDPVFRSFQAELEVVYEEKNMYSDMFFMNLFDKFNEEFFKNHPYGQKDRIGTIEDLKNPSLTKMKEFFHTYYVANNMSLVLSGNFNSAEIEPLIREKFGRLKSGEIPARKEYKEEPFKGRELYEAKLSPIKIGGLGFRTVPENHPDAIALAVCNRILSNTNQTGLVDRLSLEGELLAAQVVAMPYNDHGATLILVIPKIIGQKLEDAEKLVMDELAKLRKGEFDDWMVQGIKNELLVEYQVSLESVQQKTVSIASYFAQERDVQDFLSYPEMINEVTKDQVIEVANKYYGENYLAFYSKMGFPKKEKIEKPGYEPLVANTDTLSKFTAAFNKMPAKDPVINYVDFTKDFSTIELMPNINLYTTKNPVNDVFEMKIKYGIGEEKLPLLLYASQIMNYSGVDTIDVLSYKNEFSKIGCSYSIYSDDSYLTIELSGMEKNYLDGIKLLNKIITNPTLDKEKLDIILQGVRSERQVERSEPDNVASALFEYIRFGEKSSYIDRLTMGEIKGLNTDSLVAEFLKATEYAADIHYSGKLSSEEIAAALKNNFEFAKVLKESDSPVVVDPKAYKENTVYFVNKKKSVQSKIFLYSKGKSYDKKQDPVIDAFNMYFGGGFSGLVLQEVREYRSLAYTAGAVYRTPPKQGANNYFMGYVGTQSDKTLDALEIFYNLVKEMPEKPERMEMIKQYLTQSAMTATPHFRDLTEAIVDWKINGYHADPRKENVPVCKEMEFEDILEFYQKNLKDQSMVFAFVGDKKRIDMKEVEKYGKIIEIKEKSLFK